MFRWIICCFLGHTYPLASWTRGFTYTECRRCGHHERIRS